MIHNSHPLLCLPPYDLETEILNAIIDTPCGSRNKYKFDEQAAVFRLHSLLPAGATFPYDFGYIPGTRGADGDPVDVLVLMEEPAFVGCVVPARLVGIIEAEQTESDKSSERNDRLIAISTCSHRYERVKSIKDLDPMLIDEIEYFFESYNRFGGKKFRPLGRHGPKRAWEVLRAAMETPQE